MGAKPKTWDEADEKRFKSLCQIMCTKAEVCAVMDVDAKTLDRLVDKHFGESVPHEGARLTFSEAFEVFSARGKMSLRRKQFELALEGDKSMLVWLGKNYLDQTDQRPKPQEHKAEEAQKSDKAKVLEMAIISRNERSKKAI